MKSLPKHVGLSLLVGTAALTSILATSAEDLKVKAEEAVQNFKAADPGLTNFFAKAAGYAILPGVGEGGFIIGGEHGDGALQEGGKTVGYYSISGASIGLTFGLSHHSEVILFNTPQARDKFVNGSDWSVGADTSVAVMKQGAGGDYDTQSLSKPVNVFVFGEKGLMGDASLGGAKISKIKQ